MFHFSATAFTTKVDVFSSIHSAAGTDLRKLTPLRNVVLLNNAIQDNLSQRFCHNRGNFTDIKVHCVTTEKVPAKYRSLKMAEASLGKWSIFGDCGGIARTRQWLNMHMDNKSAYKRFRIPGESQESPVRLYEAFVGPW